MQCPSCGCDNLPGVDECEHCKTSLYQEDTPAALARTGVEKNLNEDTVENLEPTRPVSVTENTTLAEAVETMRAERIGCLLIVNAQDELSGIFTERDVLTKVIGQISDLTRQTVAQVMTHDPETVKRGHLLAHALHRIMVGDLRYLPVIDDDGGTVGVVSSRDIICYIESLLGTEEED